MKRPVSFWITNSSKFNVSLADLALTIKPYTSINLLDKKHYTFTLDQLQKSQTAGSIFNKRDKISVRLQVPLASITNSIQPTIQTTITNDFPSKLRSTVIISAVKYKELELDGTDEDQKKQDEAYASEMSDLTIIDQNNNSKV